MIKLFFATVPICLAVGSAIGYHIHQLERERLIVQFNQEGHALAAAPKPSAKPLSRDELEKRFTLCIGRPMRLKAFSDKDLNDSLAECETAKK